MRLHVHAAGVAEAVTHVDVAGDTRLREILIIEEDEVVYRVGDSTEIDIDLTVVEIFGNDPGHVVIHRCREIVVTIEYQGRSVVVKAGPAERLGEVREQAIRELPLTPGQETDLVLRLPGSTEELPEGQPVGAFTRKGTCALTLDLVHAVRPQG